MLLFFKSYFKFWVRITIVYTLLHHFRIQMLSIIVLILGIRSIFCLLKPRMSSYLINSVSLFWIGIQDSSKHINSCSWKPFRNFIIGSHNFLIKLTCDRIFKRKVSTYHGVKDNSWWPNIHAQTVVPLACNHFWSSVAWRSTSSFKGILFSFVCIWKSEINDLNSFIWIKQQVFRFQISMTYIYCMNVFNTCYKILVESASLSLSKPLFWNNIVKEFSSMTVLHDHVVLGICLYYLIVNH